MADGTLNMAKQSDSIIIMLIIVLVACLIALRPIIKMLLASKEKRHERDFEQQTRLMKVIQSNTEVNASLKTVLEENHKACKECRSEQLNRFRELQDTQDIANMKLVEIKTMLQKGG